MGLIPQLKATSYSIDAMVFKDAAGHTTVRLPVEKLYRALGITDRYLTLDRRDFVETLYHAVQSDIEVHFGTSLTTICQSADGVAVTTTGDQLDGRFDLVVGADGIHSNVRRLVFGQESQYANYLGYYVAAFYAPALTGKLEAGCVIHVEPDVQFGIYPLSSDRWLVIPIYKSADEGYISPERRLAVLRSHLRNVGWITQEVLDKLAPDAPIFLDAVTQIKMPKWSCNRVVLIGDAAHCSTLISGQGAALAMAGAYFLTEELNQTGDPQAAMIKYEKRLRPHVEKIQTKAKNFAPTFVPSTQLRITLSYWAMRLIDFPPVTQLFGKQLDVKSFIPAAN
jgi:2-polyprenyl-6-methoxyphenol hydroxylase-like FAD-dependent oxidoreductase